MRAKIVILVLAVGVLAVAVLLFTMNGRPHMAGVKPEAPPAEGVVTKSGDRLIGGGVATFGDQLPRPTGVVAPTPVDPEFQKFLSEEAKQVDATHIDGEEKRKQLGEVVKKLTPAQSRQLLQTAQSPASTAGEKILSAYLMVEAGPLAENELRQLITAPLNTPGPQESHSEGELRAMQERSVRAMAIDGLIARAEKVASARETLAKTIPDIPDPYIKSYAEKRLAEIKAH